MTAFVRRLVRWLAVLAAVAVAIATLAGVWLLREADRSTAGSLAFANELAIPRLLEPTITGDGVRVFDLALQAGRTELLPGTSTDTWGVNGSYLGPTLRARRGDDVLVRVSNGLPEATTLHWHGMRLPGAMDGGPHQMIEPDTVWEPTWTIEQPAATLWYHPHPHHRTADHVYRGVAGLFLLDDAESDALPLPSEYGVDDIPLIVQDKQFHEDGSLSVEEGPANLVGVLGDEVLVNGTHDPHLTVHDRLVRLRLLNASNARVYNFGFADDRSFALVAGDSGLLAGPVEVTRVALSPGERAEVVVAVEPGERATLRSYPPDLGMNPLLERMNGGGDTLDILQIRAARQLRDSPALPDALARVERLDEGRTAVTRTFELSGFSRINGQRMDLSRVDQRIPRGAVETWEVTNASNTYHSFHVHLVHFQILELDGRAPPPELAGWKDTVFLPPGARARIIARFDAPPDPAAPFMYHCHILQHEDAGMMGQFTITPGGGSTAPTAGASPPGLPAGRRSRPPG